MTNITIIGSLIMLAGVIVTVIKNINNSKIYHYGYANAKIVDKRSMRQFYECGEYDKIILDKLSSNLYLSNLKEPCRDPKFTCEQPLYPVYEYTYNGELKRVQSYLISYAPLGACETIYLDENGNVNDASKQASLNVGMTIIAYGVSVLVAEGVFKLLESIPDVYPRFQIGFCFFGNIGIALILSSLYDLLCSAKNNKIDADVAYEFIEAQTESDDGKTSIVYMKYPVIHYVSNGKEIWHRTAVGSNHSSNIDKVTVRENMDGLPVDSKSTRSTIFLGIIWIAFMIFACTLH